MSAPKPSILAIVGQGYVGLPLALAAVEAGWSVIGIESSQAKINQIQMGQSPVEDVSDSTLLNAISSKKYFITSDFSQVSAAEIVVICVPTPLDENSEPDLRVLRLAVKEIAPHLSDETLLISESTSYPGTLRSVIVPIVDSLKPKSSKVIYFAVAPERVNPGDVFWHQRNTPRLIGGIDEESHSKALNFYRSICDSVVPVNSPEVAEAAKLLENSYRLVNISLINEFAQICSKNGLSASEVIDAAATKPYGYMPFKPSVGVGGHCIPVDPMYLTWWARESGASFELIEKANLINREMPKFIARRGLSLLNSSIETPRVLILGVAYKSGISDVRETAVRSLILELRATGAEVAWHDPLVSFWDGENSVDLNWSCDLVIVATMQPAIELSKILSFRVPIFDTTGLVPPSRNVFRL